MTVPAILSTFEHLLDTDPTSDEMPLLARRLAQRIDTVAQQIHSPYLPVSLLTIKRYHEQAVHLARTRQHLQAYGLDLMPVRSVTGDDIVLYVHHMQAQPAEEVAS